MQKKCVVCGKTRNLVVNTKHPEKMICVECLNGFLENVNTLEKELDPLISALTKGADALKKELDRAGK